MRSYLEETTTWTIALPLIKINSPLPLKVVLVREVSPGAACSMGLGFSNINLTVPILEIRIDACLLHLEEKILRPKLSKKKFSSRRA